MQLIYSDRKQICGFGGGDQEGKMAGLQWGLQKYWGMIDRLTLLTVVRVSGWNSYNKTYQIVNV